MGERERVGSGEWEKSSAYNYYFKNY
jgi:hypothetical protein